MNYQKLVNNLDLSRPLLVASFVKGMDHAGYKWATNGFACYRLDIFPRLQNLAKINMLKGKYDIQRIRFEEVLAKGGFDYPPIERLIPAEDDQTLVKLRFNNEYWKDSYGEFHQIWEGNAGKFFIKDEYMPEVIPWAKFEVKATEVWTSEYSTPDNPKPVFVYSVKGNKERGDLVAFVMPFKRN